MHKHFYFLICHFKLTFLYLGHPKLQERWPHKIEKNLYL